MKGVHIEIYYKDRSIKELNDMPSGPMHREIIDEDTGFL